MTSVVEAQVRHLQKEVTRLKKAVAIRDELLKDCIGVGAHEVTIHAAKRGVGAIRVAGLRMLAAINSQRENSESARRKARRGADRLEARVRALLGLT